MPHRLLVLAALVAALPVGAQTGRPTPQELFDRHARAVGGLEAWARTTTREDVGIAVVDGDTTRVTIRWAAAPRRWAQVYDFPDTTQVWNGFDGRTAWYENGMGGERVGGVDSLNYALAADPAATLWPAGSPLVQRAEVVGEESFAGERTWRVRVVHPGDVERTLFFSQATGRRVGEIAPNSSGARTITILGWRTVDGLVVPVHWTVRSAVTTREFRIATVRFGVPLDDALFRTPPFGDAYAP